MIYLPYINLRNWWKRKSPSEQHAIILDGCTYALIATILVVSLAVGLSA